jgi:hypothetical protein
MKASEMICLLAKQIEMHGDREVRFVGGNTRDVGEYTDSLYKILSVTNTACWIEIYGEGE